MPVPSTNPVNRGTGGERLTLSVLDVPVESITAVDLLERFDNGLLVFHNMDTIYKAMRDRAFLDVCRSAEFSAIDGQVLRGLLALLWTRRVAKVSGSDFLRAFCNRHAHDPTVTLFLLGAGPGVAAKARDALNGACGRDLVVGAHSPSFTLLTDPDESDAVVRMINESGATALAVGLGAPKQELWMAQNRHKMPQVRRLMAVGATLDFEAGRMKRAPAWMNASGLEWLYRLLHEPRRLWRRYLIQGPQVVFQLVRWRLSSGNPPPPSGGPHH